MAPALGCCLAVGFEGGWAGVRGSALAAGTGFGACVGGVARRLGGGVLGEVVLVELEEIFVVVEVRESGRGALVEQSEGVDGKDAEAEEMDVGDAGAGLGSRAAIWFLWARRVRVRVLGIGCVRALSLVSCVRAGAVAVGHVVCGVWWCCGVVLDAQVGEFPQWVHVSCRTCGSVCWRQCRVPKKACWMPGMYTSVS